jgi:putative addiction module component (TIGR02574 family)
VVARRAHNPKVVGSNPAPATNMMALVEHLSQEALSMTLRDRALLATRILESMDEATDSDAEQAWYDLAEMRLKEIDNGAVQTISEDEVRQRVRARIR